MGCMAANPASPARTCCSTGDLSPRSRARPDLRWTPATFCASNHPVEADTVSRIEVQPVTPWAPQPVTRVAMSQTWRHLTFLHGPYEPALVQPLLPPGLVLDTFDGAAWIGLVPFEIRNLRGIPHFPETNVRTYVIGPNGGRAVWFFSLDAARLPPALGARVAYHLPYFSAKITVVPQNYTIPYRNRPPRPHSLSSLSSSSLSPA